MNDLEVLEHRVSQWHELPLRSVQLMDVGRLVRLVNEMEAGVEADGERRRVRDGQRSDVR